MDKIDFINLIPSETQKNNGIMEFSCLEIHYKNDEVKPVPISFATCNTEDDSIKDLKLEIAKKYNISADSIYVEY